MNKLNKVSPTLILSCKSVPILIRQLLLSKNISLICKIEPSLIDKIAKLTNGIVIKNINEIDYNIQTNRHMILG